MIELAGAFAMTPHHRILRTGMLCAPAVCPFLGEPPWQNLANGRLIARLPDLFADLGAQWQVIS